MPFIPSEKSKDSKKKSEQGTRKVRSSSDHKIFPNHQQFLRRSSAPTPTPPNTPTHSASRGLLTKK